MIDLADLEAIGGAGRARFVARVCDEREQELIALAPDPHLALWSHFAAKEAAFKVVAKLRPDTIFAHRLFHVDLTADLVLWTEFAFDLRLAVTPDYVHAVVAIVTDGCRSTVAACAAGESGSSAARRLLCGLLASSQAPGTEPITIVRDPSPGSWDGFAPPRALLAGKRLPVDVSLSHHGRFAACAVVPATAAET